MELVAPFTRISKSKTSFSANLQPVCFDTKRKSSLRSSPCSVVLNLPGLNRG